MTTYENQTKAAMMSNETLREIVASSSKKFAFFRWYAKQELARRDLAVGLA